MMVEFSKKGMTFVVEANVDTVTIAEECDTYIVLLDENNVKKEND